MAFHPIPWTLHVENSSQQLDETSMILCSFNSKSPSSHKNFGGAISMKNMIDPLGVDKCQNSKMVLMRVIVGAHGND